MEGSRVRGEGWENRRVSGWKSRAVPRWGRKVKRSKGGRVDRKQGRRARKSGRVGRWKGIMIKGYEGQRDRMVEW